MTTIVTRSGKAAPLTNAELDANFTNLNTDKLEKGSNLSDLQSVSQARTNLGLGDLATQNKASLAGPVVLTDSSTSPALKITQTGTGNALVVEDVASDTTPFVVDQNGRVFIGNSSSVTGPDSVVRGVQITNNGGIQTGSYSADAFCDALTFVKSRGSLAAPHAIVANGDTIGGVYFAASDGSAFLRTAQIECKIDGTPGLNDIPGRLVFSTTSDNSATPTERMRIRSDGNVGVGTTGLATYTVTAGKNVEGGTTAGEFKANGTIQTGVTSLAVGYSHQPVTAAAAFTCANIQNFRADGVSLGAGSSVTTQAGFIAESGIVNATNNYGFYGNIPAGTGRYNFYAAGTADNYFAGNVGIGAAPEPSVALTVRGAQHNHRHNANDAAPIYHANVKARGTSGTPLTVNNNDGIASYQAYAYDGSGERQSAAIVMQVDGVPATSTVPGRIVFSTAPAGTSQVPLERLRIDSSGNVLVKSAAGLGYGAGAGGTVTQVTSRTTGVTLHKPTGRIDLVSAAGSATWATFSVTNSVVEATDTVVVSAKTGSTNVYICHATVVSAGSFQIAFATTGGTATDTVSINFCVIKGAIA